MNKLELLNFLKLLDKKTKKNLLSNLEERKLKEMEFHNRDRDRDFTDRLSAEKYKKFHGNKKFYSTVKTSSEYVVHWIKEHCRDKIFLDYACGNGGNAIKAAKAEAALSIGIDISDISINNARNIARKQGISDNTFFLQADCEDTGLPDCCIDVGICSGVLHHLDLSHVFLELRRILKPGGIVLAIEALNYNPLIKLYRIMTPQMRTKYEKEHILSYKDLKFASRYFHVREIKHWHLFSIAGVLLPIALPLFNAIDKFFLRLPVLKLMSWMFTFELHGKD